MMMAPIDGRVTGGIDTHDDIHVAAVCDSTTARMLATSTFPTTPAGYACLLAWMNEHGTLDRVGVESTGSWGAGLTRHLAAAGIEVIEVDRPAKKAEPTARPTPSTRSRPPEQ